MHTRRLVIIESPFAAPTAELRERNLCYARACLRDSLNRGEAPYASHLLYTQVLDDDVPAERIWGIEAGLSIAERADASVVYTDLGVSRGMEMGIEHAKLHKRLIEFRTLAGWDWKGRNG